MAFSREIEALLKSRSKIRPGLSTADLWCIYVEIGGHVYQGDGEDYHKAVESVFENIVKTHSELTPFLEEAQMKGIPLPNA